MSASTLITDYMGEGTHAARPNPGTLAAQLPAGATAIYSETDTGDVFALIAAAWVQINGGGSGGGASIPYIPAAVAAPTASEFTVNVSAGFAGPAVANLASNRGVSFTQPAASGFQAAFYQYDPFVPPAAGTDFTVKCLVANNSQLDGNWHFGLYLQDTTGQISSFGIRNPDYSNFNYSNYSNVSGQTNTNTCQNQQGPWWYRVSRAGTQINAYMSQDGETWAESFSVGSTSFLVASLAAVGFSVGFNGGGAQAFTCFAFESSEP